MLQKQIGNHKVDRVRDDQRDRCEDIQAKI